MKPTLTWLAANVRTLEQAKQDQFKLSLQYLYTAQQERTHGKILPRLQGTRSAP